MDKKQKIDNTNKKWIQDRCKYLVANGQKDDERAIVQEWSERELTTAA